MSAKIRSKEEVVFDYVKEIISDDTDLFIVEIRSAGDPQNMRLQVYLDGDDGLGIDKCASISRQLGARLEEHDLFEAKYTLEVSSPGLDMPLKMSRQYHKNIGRVLKFKTIGGAKVKGELLGISEKDEVRILLDSEEEKVFDLKEIEEAKVTVSFK